MTILERLDNALTPAVSGEARHTRRMPRLARILLLGLLMPGCYLSHEYTDDAGVGAPDEGPTCMPPGMYTPRAVVESDSPSGCLPRAGLVFPLQLPLRAEQFNLCPPDPRAVVQTGPCTWTIDVDCLAPDMGYALRGTISTEGGAIHGRLTETSTAASGCNSVVIVGD
jgi:hypothetical protein